MQVKELIGRLKKLPADTRIVVNEGRFGTDCAPCFRMFDSDCIFVEGRQGATTVGDFASIFKKLPADAEIFVRTGLAYDDAYTATLRIIEESGVTMAEITIATENREHRNFPEAYSGVQEIKL